MATEVYFGTVGLFQWIPAPAINMPTGQQGYEQRFDYLNGAADVAQSKAAHREYEMSWSMQANMNIDMIVAYKSGVYGPPPYYYLDPAAMAHNVAPMASWAHAALACYDGPNLAGIGATRPTVATTASNTQAYPIESALYTLTGTETVRKLLIPIPSGYTLYLGAHGTQTGTARVSYKPAGGSVTALTLLGHNVTTLTNATVSGVAYAEVYLTGAGTLTLSSLIAQILPTGSAAPTGKWRTGRGTWGLKFDGPIEDVLYSAALDRRNVSCKMIEVW
mgnify:CR=1 FL=1